MDRFGLEPPQMIERQPALPFITKMSCRLSGPQVNRESAAVRKERGTICGARIFVLCNRRLRYASVAMGETAMRYPKSLAAAISLSLISAPALAQTAAPLSLSPAGAQLQQASNLDDDNYLLPAVVIFGLLAAAILLTSNGGKDLNNPASP
jgi:hypothetical protein